MDFNPVMVPEIEQPAEILNPAEKVETLETVTKKKRSTGNIPTHVAQVIYTGNIVRGKISGKNWTSELITPEVFGTSVDNLIACYEVKTETKAEITPTKTEIDLLDEEIGKGLDKFKGGLQDIYGREPAKAQYGRFGISKESGTYTIPRKREKRVLGLAKMVAELEKGEVISQYATLDYWKNILQNYEKLINTSSGKKGTVSVNKALVAQYKDEIVKGFNIYIHLIHANVPKDQVAGELRDWGFQKERY